MDHRANHHLIAMAIPSTQVLIAMYDTGGEGMTVEVRGYQWKWQYKYLDEHNRTFPFSRIWRRLDHKSTTAR